MMKQFLNALLLFILIPSFVACNTATFVPTRMSSATLLATPILTDTPTLADTPTPSEPPTLTASPTLTPTQTLTPTITPTPTLVSISANNYWDLELMQTIGRGGLVKLALYPDENTLALTTGKGIYLFDGSTLEEKKSLMIPGVDLIRKVAFSAQSEIIAISSQNSIVVWNPLTDKSIKVFSGSGAVALSSDASLVAISTDKTIVWNLLTNSKMFEISDRACGLSFSPDAKMLVVLGCVGLGRNPPTVLWDVNSGKQIRTAQFQGYYDRAIFSPDGKYMAVNGSRDIILWDLTTYQFKKLSGHRYPIDGIAFSPDSRYLAAGVANNPDDIQPNILVWEIKSGNVQYKLQTGRADDLLFSADSSSLYVNNGNVQAVNLETGKVIKTIVGFGNFRSPLSALDSNGRTLLAYNSSGLVNLWDITAQQPLSITIVDTSALKFLADGSEIITFGYSDEVIRIRSDQSKLYNRVFRRWDIFSGELLQEYTWKGLASSISPDISRDERYLASGGTYYPGSSSENLNTVRIWDVHSGEKLFDFYHKDFNDLAFSPDNQYLVTVGVKQVKLWDVSSGELLYEVYQQSEGKSGGEILTVAFSSDGRWIITGGRNGIEIWDVSTMKSIHKIDRSSRAILVSPMAQIFATISPTDANNKNAFDGVLFYSWNDYSPARLQTIYVGYRWGSSVRASLSPDGNLLLTQLGSDRVMLWEVSSGRSLKEFPVPVYYGGFTFSPDMKYIIFSCSDGTIQVYGIRSMIAQKSSGYATNWDFDTNSDAQGWEAWNHLTPLQVKDGFLFTKSTGDDPYMASPVFSIFAGEIPKIEIRMKVSAGDTAQVFFITNADTNYDEIKSLRFGIVGDGTFHTYTVDMSKVEKWEGFIQQIRLDPTENIADIEIDYIRLAAK